MINESYIATCVVLDEHSRSFPVSFSLADVEWRSPLLSLSLGFQWGAQWERHGAFVMKNRKNMTIVISGRLSEKKMQRKYKVDKFYKMFLKRRPKIGFFRILFFWNSPKRKIGANRLIINVIINNKHKRQVNLNKITVWNLISYSRYASSWSNRSMQCARGGISILARHSKIKMPPIE